MNSAAMVSLRKAQQGLLEVEALTKELTTIHDAELAVLNEVSVLVNYPSVCRSLSVCVVCLQTPLHSMKDTSSLPSLPFIYIAYIGGTSYARIRLRRFALLSST